jgi:hypothetical protein
MGTTAAHIKPRVTQLDISHVEVRGERSNVQSNQGSRLDLSVHTVCDCLTDCFQRSESSSVSDVRYTSAQLLSRLRIHTLSIGSERTEQPVHVTLTQRPCGLDEEVGKERPGV